MLAVRYQLKNLLQLVVKVVSGSMGSKVVSCLSERNVVQQEDRESFK